MSQFPDYPPPPHPGYGVAGPPASPPVADLPPPAPKTEGLAIASLCLSLLGLVIGLAAIAGIILGFQARGRIRRANGALKGSGLAMAGIVVGIAALVVALTLAVVILERHPSTSPGSSAPAATAPSGDQALAQRELLSGSVFPTSWKDQGASSGPNALNFFNGDSPAVVAALSSCLGLSSADVVTQPAEAVGHLYTDAVTGASGAEAVEVFPTQAAAVADVTAAADPQAPSCLLHVAGVGMTQDLRQSLAGSGVNVHALSFDERPVAPYGKHDADLALSVPISEEGVHATLVLDLVYIQSGRSEAVLFLSNLDAPASSTQIAPLASAAAARLAAG